MASSLHIKSLPTIYLGSTSPRRKELLLQAGFKVKILSHGIHESFPKSMNKKKIAVYLAEKKLHALCQKVTDKDKCMLTADSVVLVNNTIVGKPKDFLDAKRILKKLSNTKHQVITGVAIQWKDKKKVFSQSTTIFLDSLTDEMITYYLKKYSPYDKAGAYGIQEWIGLVGVKRIIGDFYNVTGLPIHKIYACIKEMQE